MSIFLHFKSTLSEIPKSVFKQQPVDASISRAFRLRGGVEARCDEREQEGGLVGSVSSQLHNGRTIIHDDVDSHKLLKYL